jgi:hypothetical protein
VFADCAWVVHLIMQVQWTVFAPVVRTDTRAAYEGTGSTITSANGSAVMWFPVSASMCAGPVSRPAAACCC